ncbi:Mov34/MPN/PAD-1 family protein [Myroides odoratimimus]|uniref:Mov34/MPN/PAD-1 family protein n=1 Tax=Myroides odoratimimus TaxID=76832 RepID=UPI00257644D4|nr:Mov34/MPN/PAD-1 family protein [Myroides odoratimimus]MDM1537664.1 Mov34/MPN/PAD-1 family protein [Myroides odoratimimus]MDM1677197.1 Mov34/MPN/PAD-1 family protein [Myroides odoratimimus]MEC4092468.1 Mov34/MPN/PAD-1 family protein [Myroides odoratimimus]
MNIDYCDLSISLSKEVVSIFKKYIQNDAKKPESGGIITGKIYENLVDILNCSEPSHLDKRSRYNYNRSHKSAQIYINEKFEESGGREIYLGEWHTHPEDIPIPSDTDIKSFNKTLTKNVLNSDVHFMIIVGRTAIYLGIYFDRKFINKLIIHFP